MTITQQSLTIKGLLKETETKICQKHNGKKSESLMNILEDINRH